MSRYDLTGKVFFVTGGAEGIGKCIAVAVLSKQAQVFFVDIQEELGKATEAELAEKYGVDNVAFAQCDIQNRQRMEETFQQAVAKFGQVDVMVNNAGICGETKPEAVVSINILGTVYGTETAQRHMRKDTGGKGGRIINVSSIAAMQVMPYIPVYGASKEAIWYYTKSLSLSPILEEMGMEYATLHPDGVKTNLYNSLKNEDLLYYDDLIELYKKYDLHVPVEQLVASFLDLVTLEKMNGASLLVTKQKQVYATLEKKEFGDTYPPPSESGRD